MAPLSYRIQRRQDVEPGDDPLPGTFETATPLPTRVEEPETTSRTRDSEAEDGDTSTRGRSETSTGATMATTRSTGTSSLSRTSPSSSVSTPAPTSPSRTTSSPSPSTSSTSQTSDSISTRTGSPPSESMIWPNSFPPDFPVETHEAIRVHSGGRGYLFLNNNELLDSLLIFVAFFVTSLVLTVILIKTTQIMSRRRGSKVDQMVGEDMKWAERREVLERKIIWEGSGGHRGRTRGDKMGCGPEAQMGWRELSERERLKGKQR